MSTSQDSSAPVAGAVSKSRLPILDGLRGVAAMIVVAFHVFDSDPVNPVNHGYLAVDFFFMLSGFVMGYAYDDRWGAMSVVSFMKRRLVRLHPMVVVGSIIGAIFFYFGASGLFGNISGTSFGMLMASVLLGALLVPSWKSMDVRGWGESYPLNGPAWSLFFEYIANILYAFGLRKFSLRTLGVLAGLAGAALVYVTVTSKTGSISFGFLPTAEHQVNGLVRVLFPFIAGLFLFRLGKTISMKHAVVVTSAALIIAFLMPRVGPASMPWVNGVYESLVILLLMPLVVLVGAGNRPVTRFGEKACAFLGELSYPLYLVHYPIHYVFFAWLNNHKTTAAENIPLAILVYGTSLALGFVVMRFVDTPVRKRLARFAR